MHVQFVVDEDIEGSFASLKSRNVEIISEPAQAPWRPDRIVLEFRDSEGNLIVIASK
jgi:hypothetical protein